MKGKDGGQGKNGWRNEGHGRMGVSYSLLTFCPNERIGLTCIYRPPNAIALLKAQLSAALGRLSQTLCVLSISQEHID